MHTKPLSDALGAQILDFDVTSPCSDDEQAELRQLLCEHHLLVVRGQSMTAEDHKRFVGYFGPLEESSIYVTNKEAPTTSMFNLGQQQLVWHSDGTWTPQPWIAVSLWAEEVSPRATPTLFANAVRALDRLPADLRAKVESLHTVHLSDREPHKVAQAQGATDVTQRRWREIDLPADASPERFRRTEHPIVFALPHTQQKALLVHQQMTSHVVELPLDQSEALIQELWGYIYSDDNVYTHSWRTGDIVIWDNIAVQHARPSAMGVETRHLHRQALAGWYSNDGVLDWAPELAYQ